MFRARVAPRFPQSQFLGQITGFAQDSNGVVHGLLLKP
jgi:hypothetical protein